MIQKIIITIGFLLTTMSFFSQVRNYDETALLFSQENIKGTARFTAMSGAFGALGGNLSAANVNPAGLAIFNNSEASITLNNSNNGLSSNFYNSKNTSNDSNLDFTQGGAVLILTNNNTYWSKFAVGINITNVNNFDTNYRIHGNNNISNENFFTNLNGINYPALADSFTNVTSQSMNNNTYGTNSKTTFTLAAKYDKYTSFGISLVSHSIDYTQRIKINEQSEDINNNTFNADFNQELLIYGEGIGFNFGIITKPFKNLRLGLAYQTPIWYQLTEEYDEIASINLSNVTETLTENYTPNIYDYRLKTPSKITGSLAYIFGKNGLISFDYNYKNYSKAKLSPTADFEGNNTENQSIKDNLTGANEFRIGGEYRLNRLSLRAGYHIEDSPYKNRQEDVTKGYSLGLGFHIFRNTKLDFSYNNTISKEQHYYLNSPNATKLDFTKDIITATLTLKL